MTVPVNDEEYCSDPKDWFQVFMKSFSGTLMGCPSQELIKKTQDMRAKYPHVEECWGERKNRMGSHWLPSGSVPE